MTHDPTLPTALKPETVEYLASRRLACFLCKRILESLDASTRSLRDWPLVRRGLDDGPDFPVQSQQWHVRLEIENRGRIRESKL